jgi:hypothetical protein
VLTASAKPDKIFCNVLCGISFGTNLEKYCSDNFSSNIFPFFRKYVQMMLSAQVWGSMGSSNFDLAVIFWGKHISGDIG